MISAKLIKLIASCVTGIFLVGGSYFLGDVKDKVDNSTSIESNIEDVTQNVEKNEDLAENQTNLDTESETIEEKNSEVLNNDKVSENNIATNNNKVAENKTEVKEEETQTNSKIEDLISDFKNNAKNSGGSTNVKETTPSTDVEKEVSNESTPSTDVNKEASSESTSDSSAYIAEIEQLIFQKVNQERSAAGLSTLAYNNTMQHYARLKSKDMGDRGYFDHANPEGQYITAQMKADGVSYNSWGENIAYISGASGNSALADRFMTNWMNSSGHRANILSTNFTSIGVGVYKIGNTYYATQEFYR